MFYFLRRSRCIVICIYRSIVIGIYVLIIGTNITSAGARISVGRIIGIGICYSLSSSRINITSAINNFTAKSPKAKVTQGIPVA